MGWRQWFGVGVEQRAEQWTVRELSMMGHPANAAGVTVTPSSAMQVPAVYACASILSQDVAKTAVKLRRRLGPDTFEDATDHPLFELLSSLVNPEQTAYDFKRSMMLDLLRDEKAFAEITRVDGRVTALWRLDPKRMRIERDALRRKVYVYSPEGGGTQRWTFDPSMPPILDLAHPSPIRQCTDLIATALALQIYIGRFFASGGRPPGVLKVAGRLTREQLEALRESWNTVHGSLGVSHKPVILEGGMDFQSIAANSTDSQLHEMMQSLRTMIASVFRVPTWRVGDMTGANYSNMEASERAYVGDALDPYFVCWEESLRRDVLTVRQYNQFSVLFDRPSLIRSDSKTLHEALAVGRQAGWYSANDVLRKLGENPLPPGAGGDVYLINTALAAIPATPGKDAHAA